MAGLVLVKGELSDKAGTLVDPAAAWSRSKRGRASSPGGAISSTPPLRPSVWTSPARSALDVGASTGGFVDCLLQRGAARVIALDVGRGQLDARLRGDPRVIVIEGANARYLTPASLPWQARPAHHGRLFHLGDEGACPRSIASHGPAVSAVVLIKPQFEAGPKDVGKGGIVRDPEVHRRVLLETGRFVDHASGRSNWSPCAGPPVPGAGGNVEYFFHLTSGGANGLGS